MFFFISAIVGGRGGGMGGWGARADGGEGGGREKMMGNLRGAVASD